MKALALDPREHTGEILRLCTDLLRMPPIALPADYDLGELAAVTHDLVDASLLRPRDRAAHEQKVHAAIRHGALRRSQGVPTSPIYFEFTALEEAFRWYLATAPIGVRRRHEATMRINMAISVAVLAALRGYERAVLQHAGAWDELVRQLGRESPLLDLPDPP